MSRYESFLRLNLKAAEDKELADYSARILRLLQSSQAKKSHFLVATLDDFLGVLYALILARHNHFEERTGPIEIQAVVTRAENVAEGTMRTSGKWLAGFYFNSALFRIAATYHRGLKIVLVKENSDKKKSDLLKLVVAAYPEWKHQCLEEIWTEVNLLKHTPKGLFDSRNIGPLQANTAVVELLSLFENWSKA